MKKIFYSYPLMDSITLSQEQTHHLNHVMRHNWKDPIVITGSDNRTGVYRIVGENDGCGQCEIERYCENKDSRVRKVLVQSLLKGDKLEWVIQKATELDVDTLYLVGTRHSVVKYDGRKLEAKFKRWQAIMMEAAQQCGRSQWPTLVVGQTLQDIMRVESAVTWLVAYENEEGLTLKDALPKLAPAVGIIIGPEGGFHHDEVQQLLSGGAQSVSLGHTILRAETAAIAGLAMLHYTYEL